MTETQIRAAFVAILAIEPRQADIAILNLLGPTVENVAEYIWDHWMGEPEDITAEDIEKLIEAAITAK